MQLDSYEAQVAKHLAAVAALGDDRTKQVADSLAAAAAPAVRLAVLQALSDAAEEITGTLLELPGSPHVTMRLDGDEVAVDVRLAGDLGDAPAGEERRDDGDSSARISMRLSEALKSDIDAAAASDGVSVNTWLVRAATSALNPNPFDSLAAFGRNFGGTGRGRGSGQQVTGWING
jgi:HicB family